MAVFATSRGPGADAAKAVTALGEHDRQKPACLRVAEKHRAGLSRRMARVVDDQAVRIAEAVAASSKVTPCFRAFVIAFCGSHSKVNAIIEGTRSVMPAVCA